jgi:SAM-dependent methyltransferase
MELTGADELIEHLVEFYDRVAPEYNAWAGGLHSRVAAKLVDVAAPRRGDAVLDVGCGTGLVTHLLAEAIGAKGSVIGIDLSARMLDLARPGARPNTKFMAMAAEHMVFRDRSFDLITYGQSLPYLVDPLASLEEAARLLRPGGRVALSLHRRSLQTDAQDLFYKVLGDLAIRHHMRVPEHSPERSVFGERERLALINGTDGMLGMLLLALHDLRRLLRVADLSAAMSTEALLGTDRAFAADLQELRPHPGQATSAANLRRLLGGSAIVASHREGDSRVQDAYSLRCAPQVNGAARDTVAHAERVAAIELVSAIDNPMILPDGRVESCGNFHGAPLGFACDFLAIAAAEVGAIAERRTDRLLDANRSQGLPPFLAVDAGVNSGVMIAHYTQAAMVAENRRLAAPASVDSLPTSAMQEDHVSMGWGAARKLRRVVDNLSRILAVELLCAARGLELRAPLTPAAGTEAARALVESIAGGAGPDRWLAPELAAVERLVRSGEVVAAAEVAAGPLA